MFNTLPWGLSSQEPQKRILWTFQYVDTIRMYTAGIIYIYQILRITKCVRYDNWRVIHWQTRCSTIYQRVSYPTHLVIWLILDTISLKFHQRKTNSMKWIYEERYRVDHIQGYTDQRLHLTGKKKAHQEQVVTVLVSRVSSVTVTCHSGESYLSRNYVQLLRYSYNSYGLGSGHQVLLWLFHRGANKWTKRFFYHVQPVSGFKSKFCLKRNRSAVMKWRIKRSV